VRVLFWGTPEFATPPLRALIGEGHDVIAVVTQPDRPRARGGRNRSTLDASPVKAVALEEGIPVLQPERPREEEFIAALRELAPDISVVVA
jgi:methionyl-tRNA formyltransferase